MMTRRQAAHWVHELRLTLAQRSALVTLKDQAARINLATAKKLIREGLAEWVEPESDAEFFALGPSVRATGTGAHLARALGEQ